MPKKINVVSLSDIKPVEEDENVVSSNDERTQITEAIKEEEALNPPEEVKPTEEATKPKPKRKPAPKKTKVVVEDISEAKPPREETIPEPIPEQPPVAVLELSKKVEPIPEPVVEVKEDAPQKKVKTLELVKCEKCNKEMTKRTLRYDHDKTCKGAPVKREDIPVQKRVKKVASPKQTTAAPIIIPEHIIEQPPTGVLGPEAMLLVEQEVKKRIQSSVQDRMQQRLKLKEERIKKLSAHIA